MPWYLSSLQLCLTISCELLCGVHDLYACAYRGEATPPLATFPAMKVKPHKLLQQKSDSFWQSNVSSQSILTEKLPAIYAEFFGSLGNLQWIDMAWAWAEMVTWQTQLMPTVRTDSPSTFFLPLQKPMSFLKASMSKTLCRMDTKNVIPRK